MFKSKKNPSRGQSKRTLGIREVQGGALTAVKPDYSEENAI